MKIFSILILDDNANDISELRNKLGNNAVIYSADSIDDYTELLINNIFDIILTEIDIFGYNELNIVTEFISKYSSNCIGLYTKKGSESIAASAMEAGVKLYLTKNYTSQVILAKLNSLKKTDLNSEKLKLIAENMQDIISIHSADGTYTYTAPAFEKFGFAPNELIGSSPYSVIDPEDVDHVKLAHQSAIAEKTAKKSRI